MDLFTVILVFGAWYFCVNINVEVMSKPTGRYHEQFNLVSVVACLTGPIYLIVISVDILFRRSVRKRRELA